MNYEATNKSTHGRYNTSIDSMRILASIFVVFIHQSPFVSFESNISLAAISKLPNYSARFAIPFFYIIAGYFFARSSNLCKDYAVFKKYCVKIALIALFWSLFYCTYKMPLLILLKKDLFPYSFWQIVFSGGKDHLWFLMSLLYGLIILMLLSPLGDSILTATASVLFSVGIFFQSYQHLFISEPVSEFATRNGVFFSFPCLFLGFMLYKEKITIGHKTLLWMGTIFFLTEFYYFHIFKKYTSIQLLLLDVFIFSWPYQTTSKTSQQRHERAIQARSIFTRHILRSRLLS